jgi:hypothetical protein
LFVLYKKFYLIKSIILENYSIKKYNNLKY